jgi:small subunit ribosomal protein S17
MADEKKKTTRKKKDEAAPEAVAEETPVAEEPLVEEAAAETPVEEPVAEAPAEEVTPEAPATHAPAEEPAAEGEAPVEEAPAEEPAAEEAPAAEAEAAEAVEEPAAEEAAPAPQSEPKKKGKRLPRAQRRQRPKVTRERPAERKPITRLPKPESDRGRRQERRGVVVSSAMDKTIVVRVDSIKAHPRYKKVVRRSVKFHAHDEQNSANVGDVVRIVETRPVSKSKRWRLVEIVEAAK